MLQSIYNFFVFKKRQTSIKKELIGGLVTFFAMLYILPINSTILNDNGNGIPYGGVFIATALISGISSIMIGLFSNMPISIAPGMGSNIFFVNTMMKQFSLSWQISLSVVIINGIIFTILSVLGIADKFIKNMPKSIGSAFIFALGLYLAYVGLKNSTIIQIDNNSFKLGNFKSITQILSIIGIILIFTLYSLGIKMSILISMLFMSFLGLIIGQFWANEELYSFSSISWNYSSLNSFKDVVGQGIFSIPFALSKTGTYISLVALIFMTLSGSSGVIVSTGKLAKLENENNKIEGSQRALISIGVSSTLSGVIGSSPSSGFLESNAGIDAGARTGLSSIFVGLLFLISIPLFPILKPMFDRPFITSPVLLIVGSIMFLQAKDILWNDKIASLSSFILIIIMIFTSSILNGMAFGLVFYVMLSVVSKKYKDISLSLYIFTFLFLIYLISMPFLI